MGGCPFLYAIYIANVHFIRLFPAFVCLLLLEFSAPCVFLLLEFSGAPNVADYQPEQGETLRKQGKTGQKLIFICSVLSHPRKIGDNKRQKTNIFLKRGCKVCAGCGSACLPFGVSTGAEVGRVSRLQDLPEVGSGPLVVCSLPLVRFSALLSLRCLRIWLYFAFLGRF